MASKKTMEYVKEHYLKNYNAPAHRVHTDQDDYNETTEAYNNVVNQQNLIRDYLARREAQAISNHNTQRFTPIQNDFTDFSTTNRMRQVKNAERIMTPRQISTNTPDTSTQRTGTNYPTLTRQQALDIINRANPSGQGDGTKLTTSTGNFSPLPLNVKNHQSENGTGTIVGSYSYDDINNYDNEAKDMELNNPSLYQKYVEEGKKKLRGDEKRYAIARQNNPMTEEEKESILGHSGLSVDDARAEYAAMTDKDRERYYYFLGSRKDRTDADKYKNFLKNSKLNDVMGYYAYEQNKDNNRLQKFGALLDAGLQENAAGIKDYVPEILGTDDVTAEKPASNYASRIERDLGPGLINDIVRDARSIGNNAIPWAVSLAGPYGNIASSLVMGAGAGGQKYAELIRQGYDPKVAQKRADAESADEALTNALMGGISKGGSVLTNAMGNTAMANAARERIARIGNPIARNAAKYALDANARGAGEFGQETMQYWTGNLYDNIFLKDDPHYTPEETSWKDALYSGYMGYLNAALVGIPNAAVDLYNSNQDAKSDAETFTSEEIRSTAEGLDTSTPEGAIAKKLADEAVKKLDAGETVSDTEKNVIGDAVRDANRAAIENGEQASIVSPLEARRVHVQQYLADNNIGPETSNLIMSNLGSIAPEVKAEDIERGVKYAYEAGTGKGTSADDAPYFTVLPGNVQETILDTIDRDMTSAKAGTDNATLGKTETATAPNATEMTKTEEPVQSKENPVQDTAGVVNNQETIASQAAGVENNTTAPVNVLSNNARQAAGVDGTEQRSWYDTAREKAEKTRGKGKITPEQRLQNVMDLEAKFSAQLADERYFGRNGKEDFTKAFSRYERNPRAMKTKDFIDAYEAAYNAGRFGLESPKLAMTALLEQDVYEPAFKAGVHDHDEAIQNIPEYKERQEKRIGGVLEAVPGTPEEYRKAFGSFGEKTGLYYVFVDSSRQQNNRWITNANAKAQYADHGIIVLDIAQDDILASNNHELTHWLREYAPQEYADFRDFEYSALVKNKGYAWMDDQIKHKQDLYRRKAKQNLSTDEAIEEILAESTGDFLDDEKFIDEAVSKHRKISERILEWLTDTADALKTIIKGRDTSKPKSIETLALRKNLSDMEHARDLWFKAIDKASETMQTKEYVGKAESKYKLRQPEKLTQRSMESNINDVHVSRPIATITENKFKDYESLFKEGIGEEEKQSMRDMLISDIYELLNRRGDPWNEIIGNVTFTNEEIKTDLFHDNFKKSIWFDYLKKKEKYIAYNAIHDVIREGKPIYWSQNHKGRKYDTVIMAGKIKVEGLGELDGNYYEVVSVRINKNDNELHLHDVMMEKMQKEKPEENGYFPPLIHDGKVSAESDLLSIPNLLSLLNNVNNYRSLDEKNSQQNIKYQLKDSGIEYDAKDQIEGKGDIEQTKDHIAVHNISLNKLDKVLDFDSNPMPSIAITKDSIGWEKFGEVSMILGPRSIDPKADKRNRIYGSDAWTPMFPTLEYDIDRDAYQKIDEKLQKEMSGKAPEYLMKEAHNFIRDETGDPEYNGLYGIIHYAENDTALKAAFLAEKGIYVEDKTYTETKKKYSEDEITWFDYLMKAFDGVSEDEFLKDEKDMSLKELRSKYLPKMISAAEERIKNSEGEEKEDAQRELKHIKELNWAFKANLTRAERAYRVLREGNPDITTTKGDTEAVAKEIESKTDKTEYREWVEKTFAPVIAKAGIPNNKFYITAEGRRLSFDELHDPVTPENIVKAMLAEAGNGRGLGIHGRHDVRALKSIFTPEYRSLNDVIKDSGRLKKEELSEYTTREAELNDRIDSVIEKIKSNFHEWYNDNDFAMNEVFKELGAKKKFNAADVWNEFQKRGFFISQEDAKEIKSIINDVKALPAEMFEAKPERAIPWSEFVHTLAPENTPAELVEKMRSKGLDVVFYDQNNPSDRQNKLKSFDDVKFQLKDDDTEGNTLSDDQKLYFYDSKITDDDGKLKPMYHGTKEAGFTVFDINKAKYSGLYGRGFYFYDEKSLTSAYGKPYEVYLNITHPLHIGTNEITKEQMRKFVQAIADNEDYGLDNYGYGSTVEKVLASLSGDDFQKLQGLNASCIGDFVEAVKLFNEVNGTDYDGIVTPTETVAFYPNQIKNITNIHPTDDPDIRYAIGTEPEDDASVTPVTEKTSQSIEQMTNLIMNAKDARPTDQAISRLVSGMIKEMDSNVDSKEIRDQVTRLYTIMSLKTDPSGESFVSAANAIAGEIIENATIKDPQEEARWKAFKKELKEQTLYIRPEQAKDLDPEGLSHLKVTLRNKLHITTDVTMANYDGTALYEHMKGKFPDYFPDDTPWNERDAALAVIDKLENGEPLRQPGMPMSGADFEEAKTILGEKIIKTYFDATDPALRRLYEEQYHKTVSSMQKDITYEIERYRQKMETELAKQKADLAKKYAANYYSIDEYLALKAKLDKEKIDTKAVIDKRVREHKQEWMTRREKSLRIKNVERNMNYFYKLINNPTDKNHLEAPIASAIQDLFDLIDTTTGRGGNADLKRKQLSESLKKKNFEGALNNFSLLANAIQNNDGVLQTEDGRTVYLTMDPDMIDRIKYISDYIRDKAQELGELPPLRQMKPDMVAQIDDFITSVRHMIETKNKLMTFGKSETISKFSNQYFYDMEKRRHAPELVGKLNGVKRLFSEQMLDSYTFFYGMGRTGDTVYHALREARDKKALNIEQAREYVADLQEKTGVKGSDIRKWKKEIHTITLGGHEVQATTGQILDLYLLNKREQARKHIYGNKEFSGNSELNKVNGGVRFTDFGKGIFEVDNPEAQRGVTEAEVNRAFEQLTPEQKSFASGLQSFVQNVNSMWGNEVSMNQFGYNKYNEGFYWPIKSDDSYLKDNAKQLETDGFSVLKNKGWTKTTKDTAMNPLIVEDVFDVFVRQVDEMSSYNAYLGVLEDITKWLNYQDISTSTKATIRKAMGNGGIDYIRSLMKDLNGLNEGKSNEADRFIGGMMGNSKAAAVGANISVAIQQPFSIIRASAEIEPKYLVSGAAHSPAERAAEYEKAKTYAPIILWKEFGSADLGAKQGINEILLGPQNRGDWLRDKQMILAEAGDTLTWKTLWMAAEDKVKAERKDLMPGSDAFYREAAETFNRVIDATQVVDSVLNRTMIMKNKSATVQQGTAFMSEPMKTANMLYREIYNFYTTMQDAKGMPKEKAHERLTKAAKRASAVLGILVANIIVTNAMKSIVGALRDPDKDKKFGERWIEKFLQDTAGDLNPINYAVFIKDILGSAWAGFTGNTYTASSDNMLIESVGNVAEALREFWKKINGDSKYSWGGIIYKMSPAINLSGISVRTLMKDIGATYDEYSADTDNLAMQYARDRYMYDMYAKKEKKDSEGNVATDDNGNTKYNYTNLKMFITEAIKAYTSGDEKLGDKIMEDLKKRIPEEYIEHQMETMINDEQGVEEAAQAYAEGRQKDYETIRKVLIDSGYGEELVDKKISSKANGFTSSPKEIAEKIASGEGWKTDLDQKRDYIMKTQGKSQKEAEKDLRSSVKRQLTDIYKQDYIDHPEKRSEILKKVYGVVIYGQQVYTNKDIAGWK